MNQILKPFAAKQHTINQVSLLPFHILFIVCIFTTLIGPYSHWLVNGFVVFGAPYMAHDIYAMYLSHYHIQKVKGHSRSDSSHSLQTVKAFLKKDWMLVLHHLVLLLIFMPITLVSMWRNHYHPYSVFIDVIGLAGMNTHTHR